MSTVVLPQMAGLTLTASAVESKITESYATSALFTEGDFTFREIDEETVELWRYEGNEKNVVIPSRTSDGRAVVSVGAHTDKQIVGVKEAHQYAFEYCSFIDSVTIPNTVTMIANRTFLGCSLKSVEIPDSVTEINESAFWNSSLEEIVIPNSVTKIGDSCFGNCKSLSNVTLSQSLEYVGDSCFKNCQKLYYIEIPDSCKFLSHWTFQGCSSLSYIKLPDSCRIFDYVFSGCSSLKEINISGISGDNIADIGNFAFENCTSLSKVSLGSNVTTMHRTAFSGCTALKEIDVDPGNTAYTSKDGVLYSKDLTVLIKIPAGKKLGSGFTVPEGVETIAIRCFEDCSTLTDVTIPNTVSVLGSMAFANCISLKSISIPDSVTEIVHSWVNGCLFEGCSSLESINVSPDNINCSSVNGILYNKNKSAIICVPQNYNFAPSYTISNSVTRIGELAFEDCSQLKQIIIPNTVNYTGYYSFSGCKSLSKITIPNSVTYIKAGAFSGCISLTAVTIPESVTEIDVATFLGCTSFTNVTIPRSVTRIERSAFGKCTSLKSITIPDSVTLIGDKAFENCRFLTISCYADSYAEQYAKDNDIPFVVLENETPSKQDLSETTITVSPESYVYDGTAKKPTVTVKNGSVTLTNGTDYTVSYSNNVNVGTANVTVTGIGKYTGTKTVTFIISAPTLAKKDFKWGSDNWNFTNSSYNGDFSSGTYRSQINSKYLNVLKENLSPSDYQLIFLGTEYANAWLDNKWGGSCYGMSSTTLLAKQGFMPYSSYKSGADELHDLNRPTSNSEVSSLITYYQMLQVNDVIQQQYWTVPKRSHETNIKELLSLIDRNDTVLVGFEKDGWEGHAILAYSYEYGSWTKNGVSYGARIKICNPNSSNNNNDNFYIYFNTKTYAWAIPAYSSAGITSAKGAVFNYIGANVDEINQGGYLSGGAANRSENYIARINAFAVSNNRSVSKVKESNGSYVTMNTAPGDIEEAYSYILGNESEGTIGYNLYDAEAAYQVTQYEPDDLELSIMYKNCLMFGGSKAGETVIFDKRGYVEVHGQAAEYAMSITMDDEYPTDWFTVEVKGQGSDTATLKQFENGWVVSADNLSNVEVKVNNKYDMAYTTFTTKYPSALIYEINEDTIGIAVDKDENGTYETVLDTKTTKANDADTVTPEPTPDPTPTPTPEPTPELAKGTYGDLDGDGKITSADSLLILRASVKLETFDKTKTTLADVDGDGNISSADALEVLRYSVKLPTTGKIGEMLK